MENLINENTSTTSHEGFASLGGSYPSSNLFFIAHFDKGKETKEEIIDKLRVGFEKYTKKREEERERLSIEALTSFYRQTDTNILDKLIKEELHPHKKAAIEIVLKERKIAKSVLSKWTEYSKDAIDRAIAETNKKETEGSFENINKPQDLVSQKPSHLSRGVTEKNIQVKPKSDKAIEDFVAPDKLLFEPEVGKKETEGKLFYEFDWEFIEACAKRMQKNKGDKYPIWNWKKPIEIEHLKQSLNRHHIEVMKGNYKDGEDELGHIESYFCNAMMIWHQLKNHKKDLHNKK